MQSKKIDKTIQFAIDKEQEAIDFYTDLAGKVKIPAVADELRKLAQMEMGHREKLKNLDVEAFIAQPAKQQKDLKIADYTVKSEVHPDMSWQDIITVAMHRELAAVNLYTDLAALVEDPAVKRLFENLAAEEQKHKLYLETLWDQDVMKEN